MNDTTRPLIVYSVIIAAVNGDPSAIEKVIRYYSGYIAALCKRVGLDKDGQYCTYVDEELRKRLEAKLIISILAFDPN